MELRHRSLNSASESARGPTRPSRQARRRMGVVLVGRPHETENKVRLGLLRIIRLKENAPETRLQLVLRENW